MECLNQIHHKNCISGIKEIATNYIHLVCTSPPYYNAKSYSHWNNYNDYLSFLKEVFTEIYRVLKEGRMAVVNISPILVPRENRQSSSQRLNLPAHFSVKYYSYVGDIVLDPFMGSGTTALSCIHYDRNYIGFEYKKEYVEMAESNIKEFKRKNPLTNSKKFFIFE